MVEEQSAFTATVGERRPLSASSRFGAAGARGSRRAGRSAGRYPSQRKVCPLCADNVQAVDYKDIASLRRHLAERGKIEPRRRRGTCARHQRAVTATIKRARHVALLPFVTSGQRG